MYICIVINTYYVLFSGDSGPPASTGVRVMMKILQSASDEVSSEKKIRHLTQIEIITRISKSTIRETTTCVEGM